MHCIARECPPQAQLSTSHHGATQDSSQARGAGSSGREGERFHNVVKRVSQGVCVCTG